MALLTCYPFDALRAGGPLRWVVTALPVTSLRSASTARERSPARRTRCVVIRHGRGPSRWARMARRALEASNTERGATA